MSSAYLTAHYAVAPVYLAAELVGWALLRYEHHNHRVIITYDPKCELLARQMCAELNEHLAVEVDYNL